MCDHGFENKFSLAMGGRNSCGCGSGSDRHRSILYDIPNPGGHVRPSAFDICTDVLCQNVNVVRAITLITDWANAVNKLNIPGIKMLHQQDPDVINSCVTERGDIAIHIAIKRKHYELFRFLLEYGGDINALRGEDGNSCLHLAVINRDLKVIQALFSNDVDDSLINKNMKTASDLITDKHFRRQFMRTKNNNRYQDRHVSISMHSSGGSTLSMVRETSLSEISVENADDGLNGLGEGDGSNESGRWTTLGILQHHETSFGSQVGCEVREIAHYLQELAVNDKSSKVWDKWIKKEHITKPHDLVKIVYGLTVLTLRNGQNKEKQSQRVKPPSQPIARLTSRMYKMLPVVLTSTTTLPTELHPDRRKRRILTKDNFMLNFHTYLYRAHEEMVHEQQKQDEVRKKSFEFV